MDLLPHRCSSPQRVPHTAARREVSPCGTSRASLPPYRQPAVRQSAARDRRQTEPGSHCDQVDPGRNSFIFLILELVISPTSGRFRLGPRSLSSSTAAPTCREEARSSFLSLRAQSANSAVTSTLHAIRLV